MKTYKNLYPKLCSYTNLERAFRKARKNKSKLPYVQEFECSKKKKLLQLKHELETLTYMPQPLTRFILHDPKTRVIKKSEFRDRIVHHALVNVLEPIYENVFIADSYANRTNKGTIAAIMRFDIFKRKVTKNGKRVVLINNRHQVRSYVLKADIRHFFDTVNHEVLLNIIKRKIKDRKLFWLIERILKNVNSIQGMPLGNMTSQFFANVYLHELDQFVKHNLRAKYYIRYVDDFVILHRARKVLECYKEEIQQYLEENLKLELHPDKSKVIPLHRGVDLLGFNVFYHYRLLRQRNLRQIKKRVQWFQKAYRNNQISADHIANSIQGRCAYARWGNTYTLRKRISRVINEIVHQNRGANLRQTSQQVSNLVVRINHKRKWRVHQSQPYDR